MVELLESVSLTSLTTTVVTDSCFELLEFTGIAKKALAQPPTDGVVLFDGRKYLISSYGFNLESSNIVVNYKLVPSFYNDVVTDTEYSVMARSWGLKFKNVGSPDIVLWNGLPASLMFNAFHAICVRGKLERQLIISPTDGVLFFGIPSAYPVRGLSFNMGSDLSLGGVYGKPAYWANYYGNQYSVDEEDTNQTVMSGGIFPPIGHKFCDIELTGDVLDWGVKYTFDTMPLLAKKQWYVYSRQRTAERVKYTMCEVLGK